MKKVLGISLVAVLAVSPLMARADTAPSAYAINSDESGKPTQTTDTPVAAAGKLFQGKTVTNADKGIVATGAYVKGAYNAAISAVNKVANDLTTSLTVSGGDGVAVTTGQDGGQVVSVDLYYDGNTNQSGLNFNEGGKLRIGTGDGVKIDNSGAVAVDLSANKGLQIDSTNHSLEIKDGDGIKTGANGVEVDLVTNGGLEINNGQLQAKVDGTTITRDANGALHATVDLTDYATKEGVVNTIESSSVQTVTGVSMTGGEGITAYTDWLDESAATGQSTLGASSITVTTGRANVEITRAEGTENTVANKYTTSAVTPAASGTTPTNATTTTTYPVARGNG